MFQKVVESVIVTITETTQSKYEESLESTLLLEELDKWKKLAISLKDQVIPLKQHKVIIDDLKRT